MAIRPGKVVRDEKIMTREERLGESGVNTRGVMRESSCMDRSKDSDTRSSKVNLMNVSSGNLRSLSRNSKMVPFSSQSKPLNQPPVMSQFSSNGVVSPAKNRLNAVNVSEDRDVYGTSEKKTVRIR